MTTTVDTAGRSAAKSSTGWRQSRKARFRITLIIKYIVAAIVLVQGAGVAESAPNPDGTRSKANRDFIGQGVGNVASALFRGIRILNTTEEGTA